MSAGETLVLPDQSLAFIPFDKSWMIRLGFLDLQHQRTDMEDFLSNEDPRSLPDDLHALARASRQWREGDPINVGESGTLFRFLQFAAWRRGEDREFIKQGNLQERPIASDPNIVHLPLAKLLLLDNKTSQWASASVLMGNRETPPKPLHYKLQLTYEALTHWEQADGQREAWQPRRDITLARQTAAYHEWLRTGTMNFVPEQAEDYCFARAFDLITPEEGEARWPSLRTQESDRIAEMERALGQEVVTSDDHRVVQSVAQRQGGSVTFLHPEAVSKSYPLFWDMIQVV